MKPKTGVISMLLAASFLVPLVTNLVAARYGRASTGGLVDLVLFIGLVFSWYSLDRRERHYKSGVLLDAGVLLVSIVALPVYFIRSRGWKSGAAASGWALVVLAISVALNVAGEMAGQAVAA